MKINGIDREEIIALRYEEYLSINEIRKKTGLPHNKIVRAILPEEYVNGDMVRCEVCQKWFTPTNKSVLTLSCSRECANRIKSLKAAGMLELHRPTEIKRVAKTEIEKSAVQRKIKKAYYDEELDMWITKEVPDVYGKFRKYTNISKTYGCKIAEEEDEESKNMGLTRQGYIDVCNYNYHKTSHREYKYKEDTDES